MENARSIGYQRTQHNEASDGGSYANGSLVGSAARYVATPTDADDDDNVNDDVDQHHQNDGCQKGVVKGSE